MSAADRVRWDTIYQNSNGRYPAADPLLFEYTLPLALHPEPRAEVRALDVACGVGQNGLWLAQQGYIVDLMDISRVALLRARKEMEKRQLRNVNLLQVDLDTVELERGKYSLVCVFRYLRRDLFKPLAASVCPGGRVIYQSFNRHYLQQVPGFNPAFLLEIGELALYFDGWDILYQDEMGKTSQLVAQKPR
ncbi:MAG: methyltransferase domain-containing protein [Chloroflexi bacterium]|nr:methyltransferase domain-containing protein [Chloroflexota bacterium]